MEHQKVEGSLLLGVSNNNLAEYQDASQGQVSEKKTGILVQDKLQVLSLSVSVCGVLLGLKISKRASCRASEQKPDWGAAWFVFAPNYAITVKDPNYTHIHTTEPSKRDTTIYSKLDCELLMRGWKMQSRSSFDLGHFCYISFIFVIVFFAKIHRRKKLKNNDLCVLRDIFVFAPSSYAIPVRDPITILHSHHWTK